MISPTATGPPLSGSGTMGEILGIGVTHYPPLMQSDVQMAGLLNRTLDSDQVPEALKDPKTWPAQMRKEWDDPVASATEHRGGWSTASARRARRSMRSSPISSSFSATTSTRISARRGALVLRVPSGGDRVAAVRPLQRRQHQCLGRGQGYRRQHQGPQGRRIVHRGKVD